MYSAVLETPIEVDGESHVNVLTTPMEVNGQSCACAAGTDQDQAVKKPDGNTPLGHLHTELCEQAGQLRRINAR